MNSTNESRTVFGLFWVMTFHDDPVSCSSRAHITGRALHISNDHIRKTSGIETISMFCRKRKIGATQKSHRKSSNVLSLDFSIGTI